MPTQQGPGSPITIGGLTDGIGYAFTVAAENAVGFGPESGMSNAVLPAGTPSQVTNVTGVAGNLSVTLSWSNPASNGGSPVTNYTIISYINGTPNGQITVGNVLTTVYGGLTNGTAYTFTVAAINTTGTGPNSAPSVAITPTNNTTIPGQPTLVTGTAGNGSVALTWVAPNNGGATITSYTATPYIGGVAQTFTTFNGSGTSGTVSGLTNNTAYTFTVHATNVNGSGPESLMSSAVTPFVSAPGAPTGLGASPGDGQVTVTWTDPASNGNSVITSYKVTSATVNGVANTTFSATVSGATATSATVTGLTDGTAYTFTVHATNAIGSSAESSPTSAVTPVATGSVSWQFGWEIPGPSSLGLVGVARKSVTMNGNTWTVPVVGAGGLDTYTGPFTSGLVIDGKKSPQGNGYYIYGVPETSNITYKSCWLTGPCSGGDQLVGNGTFNNGNTAPPYNVTILDCEITFDPSKDSFLCASHTFGIQSQSNNSTLTMSRTWIHHLGEGGSWFDVGLIQNCWIDDIIGTTTGTCGNAGPPTHNDCWFRQNASFMSSGVPLKMDANFMQCGGIELDGSTNLNAQVTTGILIQTFDSGAPVAHFRITNNLFGDASGNPTEGAILLGFNQTGNSVTDVIADNNRFTLSHGQSQQYLCLADIGNPSWNTGGNAATNNYIWNPALPTNTTDGGQKGTFIPSPG